MHSSGWDKDDDPRIRRARRRRLLRNEGETGMAEFGIADISANEGHAHQFEGRGVRWTGPAFTLTNRTTETQILWRCKECGAYEVEEVPGRWTAAQLGIEDTVVEVEQNAAGREALGPTGISYHTTGLEPTMEDAVVRPPADVDEGAGGEGPGPVEPSAD